MNGCASLPPVSAISLTVPSPLSPAQPAAARQLFMVLFLTAPRWLWPQPDPLPSSGLPPRARPRLILDRAEMVFQGRWHDLLLPAERPTTAPPRAPSDAPPPSPGHLTEADCRSLLTAAHHRRHTTIWRRLFSFGLAPACPQNLEALRKKWIPLTGPPAQRKGRPASPRAAADLLTPASLDEVLSRLSPGTAPDAASWCHESLRALWTSQAFRLALTEVLRSYVTLDCGSHAQDHLNMSALVPLRKNDQDSQVRPLAIPIVLRKLVVGATLLLCDAGRRPWPPARARHNTRLCAPMALPNWRVLCAWLWIKTLTLCCFARTLPMHSTLYGVIGPCNTNACWNAMRIWVSANMRG